LFREGEDVELLKASLSQHDQKMFRLINKYEKTYLVKEESVFLRKFKRDIEDYSALETQILKLGASNDKSAAIKLYETSGRASLESTITQLTKSYNHSIISW
jgi:hypothetical protein